MNCESLIERLGFQCRKLNDGSVAVSTSFTFLDGEPIGFYLQNDGGRVTLTDNADTLVHVAAMGFDISDRKKWKGIKQAILPYKFELLDSGYIIASAPINELRSLFTRYIAAMLSVVDIEREYIGTDERLDQYKELLG